jgi:choline dehydrogenase-like flavoprotein
MIPNEDSFCEIDPAVKDRWGIPVLRFHWKWSEHELNQVRHMQQTFRAILESMGGQIATGGRGGGRGAQQAAAQTAGQRGGGQAPQTGQAGPQTGQPNAPAGQPTTMGQPSQAAGVPISRGGAIIHEVGTVRMGNDPKTSPLNKFCQGHEVKNLFVADGAVFVSNPDKNPTHSIVALAWRTAEYLAEELRKGNV